MSMARPMQHKPPARRMFKGIAGSPLSGATAEPAWKRGRPSKYATPEQRNKAAADALRKKRDEDNRKQEINEIVKTSENVDDKHLFIVGAGWAWTGQENIDKKTHRSATASPAPSPDDAVIYEDKYDEIQAKRGTLLSLEIPPRLRWLLENASVEEIVEIVKTTDPESHQSGGKRTPLADPEKLVESATKVTGKGPTKVTGRGPKKHTLRGPEQSRMDDCLRSLVHSVIDLGENDLHPRCTICDRPITGLRITWSEHLLNEHTTDVRRHFRETGVPFSAEYFGLK